MICQFIHLISLSIDSSIQGPFNAFLLFYTHVQNQNKNVFSLIIYTIPVDKHNHNSKAIRTFNKN